MKILQVNKLYYPWIGGVEKIVQQIAAGLNGKNDFEIEVLTCQAKGKRKIEEIEGVKVFRTGSFGVFWGMPISLDFFNLFRELRNKYDIINFHHPFPLADLAIFLFRPRAKLVVHYHSDIVRQRIFEFLFRPLILNTLKKAEKILVSSPNLIKTSSYLRRFKDKCLVVPFGIDIERFQRRDFQQIQRIREKYGEFVLFVGRLNYYKGLRYLIEAMKDVPANLVIIGEGPEKKDLEFRVKKLGIQNKVFFLPHLRKSELIDFYQTTRVFVLPSIFRSEAFGIVLIEAMACGIPVISTELGTGTSWVNIDGETGFIVPSRDSMALAGAIKKILENKELSQKLGQNAFKRAKDNFTLEKMLKSYEDLYKEKNP